MKNTVMTEDAPVPLTQSLRKPELIDMPKTETGPYLSESYTPGWEGGWVIRNIDGRSPFMLAIIHQLSERLDRKERRSVIEPMLQHLPLCAGDDPDEWCRSRMYLNWLVSVAVCFRNGIYDWISSGLMTEPGGLYGSEEPAVDDVTFRDLRSRVIASGNGLRDLYHKRMRDEFYADQLDPRASKLIAEILPSTESRSKWTITRSCYAPGLANEDFHWGLHSCIHYAASLTHPGNVKKTVAWAIEDFGRLIAVMNDPAELDKYRELTPTEKKDRASHGFFSKLEADPFVDPRSGEIIDAGWWNESLEAHVSDRWNDLQLREMHWRHRHLESKKRRVEIEAWDIVEIRRDLALVEPVYSHHYRNPLIFADRDGNVKRCFYGDLGAMIQQLFDEMLDEEGQLFSHRRMWGLWKDAIDSGRRPPVEGD